MGDILDSCECKIDFCDKNKNFLDNNSQEESDDEEEEYDEDQEFVGIVKKESKKAYILPSDILIFQMAELVIIDEAAAIPLSIVKKIMPDDCLTFMASTVQGYEGTGR